MSTDGTRGHRQGLRMEWGQRIYSDQSRLRDVDNQTAAVIPDDDTVEIEDGAIAECLSPEQRATGHLLALAESAPHDCGEETCPGVQYRRAFEAMEIWLASVRDVLASGGDFQLGPKGMHANWLLCINEALALAAKVKP